MERRQHSGEDTRLDARVETRNYVGTINDLDGKVLMTTLRNDSLVRERKTERIEGGEEKRKKKNV